MTRTNCKHRLPDTYIIKDYANVVKFMKITSNSAQNRQKIQKVQNVKKTSFPKEQEENADLCKPIFRKIKTTYE